MSLLCFAMLLFSTAITNIAYDDRLTSFVFQTEDREVTPTPTVYSSYDRADLYQQFSPNLSLPSTLADSPEDEYPTTADTSQQGSRDRSHPRYKRKSSALSSSKSPYSYDQGSHLSGSANLRNPFSPNTEFFASLLDSQNEFPSIVLPCSAWNDVTPLTITSDSRSSAGRESLFGQGNKDLTSEDAPFPAPQPSHYSDGKSNRISFAKAHGIEIQRDSWSAPDQSIFRKIKIGTQTVLFDNQSLEVRLKDIFNLCKMGGSKAQHYVLQHRLDYNVRQGGIGEFGRWVSWQTALQVCDNLDLSELKQQINLAVNASQQVCNFY